MRIVVLRPPNELDDDRDVETRRLAALAELGHEVVVVAPPVRRLSAARVVMDLSLGRGLPPKPTVDPFAGTRVRFQPLDGDRLPREDEIPDADVLLVTAAELVPFAFELPFSKGVKVHLVTSHEQAAGDASAAERARLEACYRLPVHHVATTNALGRILRERYGDSAVAVVGTGIEPVFASIERAPRASKPRVAFSLGAGTHEVLRLLARQLENSLEPLPPFELEAFGHGPRPRIPGLPPLVRYTRGPSTERRAELLAHLDVLVATRADDGFDVAAAEAMSTGVVVVGEASGALPELAEGGAALVSPMSAFGLAQTLRQALTLDDPTRRSMAARARAKIASLTWERAADELHGALSRVVALEKGRRSRYGLAGTR